MTRQEREKLCAGLRKHLREGRTVTSFAQMWPISKGYLFQLIRTEDSVALAYRQGHNFWAKKKGDGSAKAIRADPSLQRAFWKRAQKMRNGCWLWNGNKVAGGYGTWRVHGRTWRANRLALILSGVRLTSRQYACHTCDQKACVNPCHLYAGSIRDNVADAQERNRYVRRFGEKNVQAKLTDDEALRARKLYSTGKYLQKELACMFGLSAMSMSELLRGKTYPNV